MLCGGKVLWCEPPDCSLRHLSFARSFWLVRQSHMCGKAVHCGGWCFRSDEGELLRGLPHAHSSELDANLAWSSYGQTRENCIAPKPPPAGNTHADVMLPPESRGWSKARRMTAYSHSIRQSKTIGAAQPRSTGGQGALTLLSLQTLRLGCSTRILRCEGPGERPGLGSLGVPGSEFRANHDLRLQASQAFLEYTRARTWR